MNKQSITAIAVFALVLVALIVGGLVANRPGGEGEGAGVSPEASRDQVAAFYRGKAIKWIIPYSPGGGYDEYVRLISPYMQKYTGARIDVLNLPGAGGMRGVNELYHSPPTGLVIGIINGSALITNQLAGIKGAEYELDKFEYMGRIIADPRVLVISTKSQYGSFQEILDTSNEVKIGATGLGGSTYVDAVISKEAFNLDNLTIIHGFDSSPVIRQSMLRGNIIGTWGSWGSAEDSVDSGLEQVILQSGRERLEDLADVPTVFEFVDQTDDPARTRAILTAWDALIAVGRSVAAPPGTPADRVAFLREAFRQALNDPELLEKAEKSGRPFDYATGEEVGQLTRDAIQMPDDIETLFINAIRGQL